MTTPLSILVSRWKIISYIKISLSKWRDLFIKSNLFSVSSVTILLHECQFPDDKGSVSQDIFFKINRLVHPNNILDAIFFISDLDLVSRIVNFRFRVTSDQSNKIFYSRLKTQDSKVFIWPLFTFSQIIYNKQLHKFLIYKVKETSI